MKRTFILKSLMLLSLFTIIFAGCEGQPPNAGTPESGKAADPSTTAKSMTENPSMSQAQKDAIKKGMESRTNGAPAADASGK